jgi:hypothetical protein
MSKNKKTIYIGVGGVARAGKNLFCDLLIKQFQQQYNLNAKQYALATELKKDCASFIKEKFNLDVYTDNTEEKKIFRDMLVWYGDAKRKQTNGKYWIQKLALTIAQDIAFNSNPPDVVIISDIRYDYYEMDEVDWVRMGLNGIFIHVSKYTFGFPTDGRHVNIKGTTEFPKIFTEPANSHEALNDPKLQKKADYLLQWEDISCGRNLSKEVLMNNEYLNNTVVQCLKTLQEKNILSV